LNHFFHRLVVLAVLTAGGGPTKATPTFFDGVFSHGWSDAKLVDTTAGGLATYATNYLAAGGNPTHHREVSHSYDFGAILVGHWKSAFVWDPAVDGSITSLDYSFDLIHKNPPLGQAVAYRLLVRQSGVDYVSGIDQIFTESWTSYGRVNQTSASFKELLSNGTLGTASPDFSASGGILTFGYISANSNPVGGISTRLSGIDNYSVTIVPEPGTLIALGTALGVLVSRRRTRRQ